MSAESPPDPILPNYNPSSWDVPTLSPEERAILDTEYITFPIAQNQDITFPVAPTAPTLADGTNTEQVATTGFVQNAITAFKSASNVWSGLQTFSAGLGITAATISAISGTFTLTGATTVSNATFSGTTTLTNPLTPAYSYNATTGTGSGKIGERVNATGTPPTVVINTPQTILTIASLSVGTWLFNINTSRNSGSGNLMNSVSTTTDSFTGALFIDSVQTGGLNAQNSTSFVIQVTSTLTAYYLVAQSSVAGTFSGQMFAIRIA